MMPSSRAALSTAALSLYLSSCAGSPLSSKTEDEARRMIPVPICVQRLPRRAAAEQVVSLSPAEYWSLLLPGFDRDASLLDLGQPDCSGRLTLGEAGPGSQSRSVNADELVVAGAADGLKIVWLPVRASESRRSGLLALVRQQGESLEVYGLGTHESTAVETRLGLERMGSRLVITALDERCSTVRESRRCAADAVVYLLVSGRLRPAARFPVEHFADASTAAAAGNAEYGFSASAEYREEALIVSEKLSVREKGRGEVRAIEQERVLRLEGGRLVPSVGSIWDETAARLGISSAL